MTTEISCVEDWLDEVTVCTKEYMRSFIAARRFPDLDELMEHAIDLVVPASDRAVLVRAGCEIVGSDEARALPGMAAFEFQNINLLVTDDFFDDRKTTRMGTDTIRQKWGDRAAVALGFVLKCYSVEVLADAWNTNCEWDLKRAVSAVEWASRWQYASQFLEEEITSTPISEVSLDAYLYLIEKATATGIAGAMELGGIIGGGSENAQVQLREFGLKLGSLLQIRDDCLDYIYDEDLICKGAFSDLFAKRRRLPLLAAYWEGTDSEKVQIEKLLALPVISLEDVPAVLDLITATKVKNRIDSITGRIRAAALEDLERLPKSGASNEFLTELVELFTDL